jgi:hypothetical protein
MPYWLPSGFVMIWVVPPTLPQLTEAGLAIPGRVVDAATGVVVIGAGEDGWVQPAITMPATTQSPKMRTTINPDFRVEIG